MKKCASCGYENEDSSRYCENCGASEFVCEKRCPQCHSVVKPDTQICNDCGAYLGGGGSPSASDKLGGMAIGDKNVFAGYVVGKQENMKFQAS